MDDSAGASAADGASRAPGPITVLGVDPADGRAVAELPRWVPAEATALYRIHPDARPSAIAAEPLANPPGFLLALVRQLRGQRAAPTALVGAVDEASGECDVPVRVLERRTSRPAVPRSPSWTVGAWVATALSVGAVLVALLLLAAAGDLLVGLFAALLVIGAAALLVGFALVHEAAGIRRADASIAAVIADGVAASDARPVVVLPTRNAAGVAAALGELGIDAEARTVLDEAEPTAVW